MNSYSLENSIVYSSIVMSDSSTAHARFLQLLKHVRSRPPNNPKEISEPSRPPELVRSYSTYGMDSQTFDPNVSDAWVVVKTWIHEMAEGKVSFELKRSQRASLQRSPEKCHHMLADILKRGLRGWPLMTKWNRTRLLQLTTDVENSPAPSPAVLFERLKKVHQYLAIF
jgi:hypothetical protein